MKIVLNGSEHDAEAGTTVVDLVAGLGAGEETRGVAVALDGEVVPRGEWAETPLAEGQRVEVVRAVQGG